MTKLLFEQHEILLIKLKFHLSKWSDRVASHSRTTAEFFQRGLIVLRTQNLICKEGPHKLIKCH